MTHQHISCQHSVTSRLSILTPSESHVSVAPRVHLTCRAGFFTRIQRQVKSTRVKCDWGNESLGRCSFLRRQR
ncbi:hypothetical protein GYH30_029321 [Glycine max]|uniref:Uncharacterized protein n=1 Tax=Glycine max TaxID=3847 RepID=A0A0R0I048_SOYBN|nr:hypothetical protein GYH30_029321 [Glycine max]